MSVDELSWNRFHQVQAFTNEISHQLSFSMDCSVFNSLSRSHRHYSPVSSIPQVTPVARVAYL